MTRLNQSTSPSPETYLQHYTSFDGSVSHTQPTSLPSVHPIKNSLLIEKFDNLQGTERVTIIWKYDGSTWVQVGHTEYRTVDLSAVVSGDFNPLSLPTTPVNHNANLTTTYITGDSLREEYDNGYIYWSFNGSTWTRILAREHGTATVGGSGNVLTIAHVTSFDNNSVPSTPTSLPSSPASGDIHIELYDNTTGNERVSIKWSYNGSSWVAIGHPEYHVKRFYATVATNLTAGSLPSTPATPGTSSNYITGDTLREEYNNGYLEWVYATSSWTLSGSKVITNNTYIIKASSNWTENGTPPTSPENTPSSPVVNDILIQSHDNGTRQNAVTRYWSYNGSAWVALTNGIHRFNMVFTNVVGSALTYGVAPTATAAATTTSYVNGDILWEKYTNGYGLYKFNNGSWAIQTHGLEVGRLQDAADFQATLGAGVDGWYVIYDHDIQKFTLSAT